MANVAKACPQEAGGRSWTVYRALPLGADQVCVQGFATMAQAMEHMPGGPPPECVGGGTAVAPPRR